ncbi:hypothetical protein [Aeromicrobium sp. Leaf350]|uniref:hypothetical protein n=1 Tax=Aeromicrobium sp. Leaf350 TaxID=2876565 RepID=UPI001E2B8034|nr:hypothetical protein [Aeromicrobium sp. Leaf350]
MAPDGSAQAYNGQGDLISIAATPWAVDAAGRPVPTHFEINGLSLTQVVEHRSAEFAYGIVADPWWNPFSWPWGKWVSRSKKVVGNALKKCGQGALVGTIGLGVGTGTTNVLIEKYGNNLAKLKVGGWRGYLGAAAAGCVINNL